MIEYNPYAQECGRDCAVISKCQWLFEFCSQVQSNFQKNRLTRMINLSDNDVRQSTTHLPVVLLISDTYSSYHHPQVQRLESLIAPHGWGILCVTGRALVPGANNDGCTPIYELAAGLNVVGVVIMAACLSHDISEEIVKRFIATFSHLPAVVVGLENDYCSSVLPENTVSMRQVVEHMTLDPHRKDFVFLRGFSSCPSSIEREEVFRAVMQERGLEIKESNVITANYSSGQAYQVVEQLLSSGVNIDGVIAANDAMASGALLAFDQHGVLVPDDALLSGFDDSDYAISGTIPITTVNASEVVHMEHAASLLLEAVKAGTNTKIEHRRVPGTLVVRESSYLEALHGKSSDQQDVRLRENTRTTESAQNVTNLEFLEYISYREISERVHVELARSTNREDIFKIFSEAMQALAIKRAFVLTTEESTESSMFGCFRLVCSYPDSTLASSSNPYSAEFMLPEHMKKEFETGVLVATGVMLNDKLAGVLIFDPKGPGRASMDGLAQSLFGALRHCQRTEYLVAQANQSLANKNKELKMYTNIMGHDLKSPLQSILAISELLEINVSNAQKMQEYSEIISRSVYSMNTIIEGMLLYSKADLDVRPEFKKVDSNQIVKDVVSTLQNEINKHAVELVVSDLPPVMGDKKLLTVVYRNLISNALKYQPKGIEGHVPRLEISKSSAKRENKHILIKDNGVGIPEEFRGNLFEPFERCRADEYDGMGLGMSICKKVMKIHNGDIQLLSSTNKGSCFQLSFR